MVFLDIQQRMKKEDLSELVNRIAHHINIPFTVGGGISSVEEYRYCYRMEQTRYQ